ncbi:hypothetical protein S83_054847 [Arachis hypogaea]
MKNPNISPLQQRTNHTHSPLPNGNSRSAAFNRAHGDGAVLSSTGNGAVLSTIPNIATATTHPFSPS